MPWVLTSQDAILGLTPHEAIAAPWVHCAVKKNTGQRGQSETIDYLPVRIFQQIHLHIVDANRVVLSLCHRSSVDQ